ncbi:MAG TPA: prepilin-type N-terminal cleavage/methylation domain-containing protein [Gemmatimonadales bacterium]|nr:prepilin-type N-terminal cleavage/methylation domain-containing protein [Gemmatimonadales bacterium]
MRRDPGFTLLEVVVALAIGAVVVLLAHQLFAAVADHGRRLIAARAALDRAANARRWLAAAFLSLDVGTEGANGFDGRPSQVAFATWLLTPDGWFERRQVTLGVEAGRLRATIVPGTPVTLMDKVAEVQFDYLLEPGAESRWVREWLSPVTAPIAVRMRVTKARDGAEATAAAVDTVPFLIKERG